MAGAETILMREFFAAMIRIPTAERGDAYRAALSVVRARLGDDEDPVFMALVRGMHRLRSADEAKRKRPPECFDNLASVVRESKDWGVELQPCGDRLSTIDVPCDETKKRRRPTPTAREKKDGEQPASGSRAKRAQLRQEKRDERPPRSRRRPPLHRDEPPLDVDSVVAAAVAADAAVVRMSHAPPSDEPARDDAAAVIQAPSIAHVAPFVMPPEHDTDHEPLPPISLEQLSCTFVTSAPLLNHSPPVLKLAAPAAPLPPSVAPPQVSSTIDWPRVNVGAVASQSAPAAGDTVQQILMPSPVISVAVPPGFPVSLVSTPAHFGGPGPAFDTMPTHHQAFYPQHVQQVFERPTPQSVPQQSLYYRPHDQRLLQQRQQQLAQHHHQQQQLQQQQQQQQAQHAQQPQQPPQQPPQNPPVQA